MLLLLSESLIQSEATDCDCFSSRSSHSSGVMDRSYSDRHSQMTVDHLWSSVVDGAKGGENHVPS